MSTVVTEESWFGRIAGAFKGILIGLVLAVISVPLLFWNEGRAVKTAKGLKEGAGAVVKLDSDTPSASNDGNFVHVTGTAQTEEVLKDNEFGVEYNGIRLKRNAEMYQWVEKSQTKSKKKLGGGKKTTTTYTQSLQWVGHHVDSGSFHIDDPSERQRKQNPSSLKFANNTQQATQVGLGGFKLPNSLIGQISGSVPLKIDPEKIAADISENITVEGSNTAYWRSEGTYDGTPQLGDMRVTFSGTPISDVSVMAKQKGETFEPFVTQQDTQLNMLSMGNVSPEIMIKQAEAANAQLTWILRGIGSGMMFLGFVFILKPLSVLADVIPFLGSLVGAGTGFVAFLLAAFGSLTTIAIAWIFYRPLLGIALLAIAAAALFMLFSRARKAKQSALENAPNPNAINPT